MDKPFENYYVRNKEVLKQKFYSISVSEELTEYAQITNQFFNEILSFNSSFMKTLPDVERYMLKSVIQLWGKCNDCSSYLPENLKALPVKQAATIDSGRSVKNELLDSLPAVGAVAGAFVGGPYISLTGAIAGYIVKSALTGIHERPYNQVELSMDSCSEMNVSEVVETLLQQIQTLCTYFDNVLATFRVQIQNSIPPAPITERFEKQYPSILKSIQELAGSVNNLDSKDIESVNMLYNDANFVIEKVQETGFSFVYWNNEETQKTRQYFQMLKTEGIEAPIMECPAVLKDDILVIPGRILIPY